MPAPTSMLVYRVGPASALREGGRHPTGHAEQRHSQRQSAPNRHHRSCCLVVSTHPAGWPTAPHLCMSRFPSTMRPSAHTPHDCDWRLTEPAHPTHRASTHSRSLCCIGPPMQPGAAHSLMNTLHLLPLSAPMSCMREQSTSNPSTSTAQGVDARQHTHICRSEDVPSQPAAPGIGAASRRQSHPAGTCTRPPTSLEQTCCLPHLPQARAHHRTS